MIRSREVAVRFTAAGFHRWPEARTVNPGRGYLADWHRHLFHFEAAVTVEHGDREVEFHDLRQHLVHMLSLSFPKNAGGYDFDRRSCEDLAEWAIEEMRAKWPGRRYRAAVFEDGEVGATLTSD